MGAVSRGAVCVMELVSMAQTHSTIVLSRADIAVCVKWRAAKFPGLKSVHLPELVSRSHF
jgi:hypothetical protein